MKLMSARASRAPAPLSTENRAPAMRAARSKSRMPSAAPRSQCGFGTKSNRPRLAAAPHFDVVGGGRAVRHARVRQIGQHQQRLIALVLDGIDLNAELPDLLRAGTVGVLDRRRVEALPLGFRDLVARRILLALQPLELRNQAPPRGFERGDLFERFVGIHPAPAETAPDVVDVIPHERRIEHGTSRSGEPDINRAFILPVQRRRLRAIRVAIGTSATIRQ